MDYKKVLSNRIYWIIGAVVLAAAAYFYFGRGGAPGADIVKAERRTVTQEVSATGNAKPVQSVDLAFEVSGRIAGVSPKVGDYVSQGQTLAYLSSTELNAQLDKANADLNSQKADLDKANVDLDNYYGNIIDSVNSAYTSANDAVRIKIDNLFTDDETNNPKVSFEPNNSQDKLDAQNQRLLLTGKLNNWLSEISSLNANSARDSLEKALADSKDNLNSIYSFLNLLMNMTTSANSLSSSAMATYKTDINDARSEIDSAISKITSLSQSISAQKASIASLQAGIKSYEASVDNIEAQISKTVLRSPISGTVTKQDAKVGEIASANSVIASVISSGSYEIDSYIPEVDIARVKTGDDARITLDAYGNDVVFAAKVISIDPGETEIEGVATYLTKLHFAKSDSRVKPGMTANIDIVSAVHENVLALPQRAVQREETREFVDVYKGVSGKEVLTEERDVTTGLRGVDGYVEILSGLSDGEEVVIPRLQG